MSANTDGFISFQIIDWFTDNYDKRESFSSDSKYSSESDEDYSDDYDSDDSCNKKYTAFSKEYKIYLFGKDYNDKTYTVEVNGFTPYFYVRVPDSCTKSSCKIMEKYIIKNVWKQHRNSLLRVTLLEKHSFRDFDNNRLYKFMRLVFSNTSAMQCAVGLFQNKEYNEKTQKTKRTPEKISIPGISAEKIYYDLYENNIDPLIKFVHHRRIKAAGWIKIRKGDYEVLEDNEFTTTYSIRVPKWTNIKPVDDNNNSRIKILAYDIECDSAHGDFPLPIKDYTKLAREIYNNYMKIDNQRKKLLEENPKDYKQKIKELTDILDNREKFAYDRIRAAFNGGNEEYEISTVFTKTKKSPSENQYKISSKKIAPFLEISTHTNSIEKKRHFTNCINKINKILNGGFDLVEGDQTIQIGMSFLYYGTKTPYKNIVLTLNTCKKISNAEIMSFKTEKSLLLKFRDLIIEEDPEIITGFNIDGFDTPWLFKRAKELDIENKFNKLSRIIDFKSEIREKMVKSPTNELIKKEYVEIPGRIQMDLLPLIQKGYNLESYKLDNVSAGFINGKVKEIIQDYSKNCTTIKTDGLKGLNIGNYIILSQMDGYLENKYKDGKKFKIMDIDAESKTFSIDEIIEIDDIKNYSWCLGKDDVSPQDIFSLQKGNSSDRAKLAYYCMMDVILCLELLLKLDLLTNAIGMANVCLNPLAWIIHRGQGVKILSLVSYFLKDKNYLLPFLYKDTFDKEGYEGAVVLNPKPGIYIDDPVSVLDYASLYPSSMIERNLSHETIVQDEKYLGDEGIEELKKLGYGYIDVNYDRFKTIFTPAGAVKSKMKVGVKTVRFVQYENERKGIIPQILRYLLNARKTTRLKIKYRTIKTADGKEYIGLYDSKKNNIKLDSPEILSNPTIIDLNDKEIVENSETYNPFQQSVFDGQQLAFKVTANSLYGQLGAKTSDIYYKEIAASTTATGRDRLVLAQEYAEDSRNYPQVLDNGETVYLQNDVVYGDSVTGDTPLFLLNKKTNEIEFKQIDDIYKEWLPYENFKTGDSNRRYKEQSTVNDYKIYTSNGWSDINRVIRHKTIKDIYRVNTHTGIVDVTEDHSLLDERHNIIKPVDLKIGSTLLHNYPEFPKNNVRLKDLLEYVDNIGLKDIREKQAFLYGFFYGDGSCGKYNCPSGLKYSWALNNNNIEYCIILQSLLYEVYDSEFDILDTVKSSGVYKIVPKKNIKDYVNVYRAKFYNKDKYKTVPLEILNGNYNIKYAFLAGYYLADGAKCPGEKSKSIRMSNKGKIGSAMLFYIAKSIGFNVSVSVRSDKKDIFRLMCSSNSYRKSEKSIKKIELVENGFTDYVYDIETVTGDFNTGFPLIVKNTDSVFVKYQCIDGKGNKLSGRAARKRSIELAIQTDQQIQANILKAPQVLEYEKTFDPFILLSKKRYVGNLYEEDPDKFYLKSMGIVLKRRDNAPIVKVVYGGIIDIIMKQGDITPAIDYLRKSLIKLVNGNYPIETLIITKTLSSYYKDPDRIAHKVLADRIAERDPGNKPQVNDRIPFIYIDTSHLKGKKSILQGDKIETPSFVRQNNLSPDYEFYITNQILKPVSQIFGLALKDLKGFSGNIEEYDKIYDIKRAAGKGVNDAIKLMLEAKRKEAAKIIFGDILRRLENKRKRNNEITSYFRIKQ